MGRGNGFDKIASANPYFLTSEARMQKRIARRAMKGVNGVQPLTSRMAADTTPAIQDEFGGGTPAPPSIRDAFEMALRGMPREAGAQIPSVGMAGSAGGQLPPPPTGGNTSTFPAPAPRPDYGDIGQPDPTPPITGGPAPQWPAPPPPTQRMPPITRMPTTPTTPAPTQRTPAPTPTRPSAADRYGPGGAKLAANRANRRL